MNVWRNVSFYNVLKIFLIGGCASLVATLTIYNIVPVEELNFVGALLIGLIEEIGKAIIVYIYIKKSKYPTILNGLLYGACVGAGFAAFESAGYAFDVLMSKGFDGMINVIFLRGFLTPGGHVAWAAISGGAIIIAFKKINEFTLSKIAISPSFLHLFSVPVVMHALWDCPIASTILPEICGFYIALIICVWFILLILVNMGLKEIPLTK